MHFLVRLAFLLSLVCVNASPSAQEPLEISGFARLIGGYLDEQHATYIGYENGFSLSQQSLLGLRGEYQLNDELTLVGQVLAHSGEDRESGIEWLYLNYEPNQNIQIKVGKQRSPFFNYSDVIDVGFAYPWITAPQQVYSSYLFPNYEGASLRFRQATGSVNFEIEAYWGGFSDDVFIGGQPVDTDIENIRGVFARLESGPFSVRATYSQLRKFVASIPQLEQVVSLMRQAGFERNVEALDFNGNGDNYQFSLNYDDLSYFAEFEWILVDSNVLAVPKLEAYYLTAGYNFYPFQVHATFSRSDVEYKPPENEIAFGISPELDQLALVFDTLVNSAPIDELDSLILGFRWDFRPNMAFKAEINLLEGEDGQRSFFEIKNDERFDRSATLYQIGIEWIF